MARWICTACPAAGSRHDCGNLGDRKEGKTHITVGVLTAQEGCPATVEMFTGNTAEPRMRLRSAKCSNSNPG